MQRMDDAGSRHGAQQQERVNRSTNSGVPCNSVLMGQGRAGHKKTQGRTQQDLKKGRRWNQEKAQMDPKKGTDECAHA